MNIPTKLSAVRYVYLVIRNKAQTMKPRSEITRLGRMRRLRQIAHKALGAYGIANARLEFLAYEGNSIYRVDTLRASSDKCDTTLYVPGRYVMRVHMDYHSDEALRSELQWLSALRRDFDAPVPEPVPALDGNLVTEITLPEVGLTRKCSLLRWLGGRFVSKCLRQSHVRQWGRLMARFHEHASGWQLPKGFTRRHRDWPGLYGEGASFEFPPDELWDAIPKRFREPFEKVTRQVKRVMRQLGKDTETYGLIHADLAIHTNILFRGGQARAIDFDDSSFGHWIYDLAIALAQLPTSMQSDWIRDVLLDGYSEVRILPQVQLKHLDLFIAAFYAELMLWMLDWSKLVPHSKEPAKHVNLYGKNLLGCINSL